MAQATQSVSDLLEFIDACPTPQHCVQQSTERLAAAGFTALDATAPWKLESGAGYLVSRSGALIAMRIGQRTAADGGFRILGAHTDSPNLRVKPIADVNRAGYRQLGVEVYGGSLTHTWLDRDLGLAGLVVLRDSTRRIEQRLVRIDRPLLRIPSLAIHLDRKVTEEGLKLNAQEHLAPMWGLAPEEDPAAGAAGSDSVGALRRTLGAELNVDPETILAWELSLMDLTAATVGGLDDAFIFAPRLDNQAMCHAALSALVAAKPTDATQVICLYDHEEVGSGSTSGAAGPVVEEVLRRIAETDGPGSSAGALARAIAGSWQISADMAHAVHPNYEDKHEPQHHPALNAGPVIKLNAQQRYATTPEGAALFESLCRDAEVPVQKYVNRTDLPCGSTIGPISAARLGVRTIDVGNPMLSMHSIREQAGAEDPPRMVEVMRRFLEL